MKQKPIWALALFFATVAWAGDYAERAHRIIWNTHNAYAVFEKEEGTEDELLAGAKDRLVEIKALDGALVAEVTALLQSIHHDAPSYVWLKKLRLDVDKTLESITGTAVRKETVLDLDPRRRGGIELEAIDPSTHDLLRAQIAQGGMLPVIALFQACALNVRVQEAYLKNLDIIAVLEDERPHLRWFDYLKAHEHMVYAIHVMRAFFPFVPDPSWGAMLARSKDDEVLGGLSRYWMDRILGEFVPANRAPDPAEHVAVATAVQTLLEGVKRVERFRSRFFPRFDAGIEGVFLSNSLFSVRGAHACLALSKGFFDYFGEPCDFPAFKKALLSYIKFYDRIADHGVMASVLEEILAYVDEADGVRGLTRLKERLAAIEVRSNVNPDIRRQWPRVVEALFEQRDRPPTPEHRNLRELLLDEEAGAVDYFLLLKRVFQEVGIGVIRDGENQLREAGTFDDYEPELVAARDILSGFEDHIEGILARSNLGGTMAEKLETLGKRVTYLDASRSSCEPFVAADESAKQTASWVVFSEGLASHASGVEPSANGYSRQIWVHRAKIANAVTIQETVEWPKRQLAGLSVVVALHAIVPNLVHTRMLLGDGTFDGTELSSLGVKEPGALPVQYVQGRYVFPALSDVIAQSKGAYREMIRRYAWKHKLLRLPENEAEITTEKIDAAFENQYAALALEYRKRHQAEMYVAAKGLQKFHQLLEDFKKPNYYVPPDAPSAILALTGDPRSENFTTGHQQQNASVAMLIEEVTFHYLVDKHGVRAARELLPRTILSTEDFLEAFRLHGVKYAGAYLVQEWYHKEGNRKILARLYEHGLNIYRRRRQYLEYARDLIYYQFPALKFEEAWRTYDGTDASYRRVLAAYQKNAIAQANRYAALGAGETDEDDAIAAILDEVVPNLPLMDMVLRTFPQMKRVLCDEQIARRLSEERFDKLLYSVEGTAAVLCFVPVVAPVAGVVMVGAMGVSLVAHGIRAYTRYQEIENARRFETAVGPQLEQAQAESNLLYYREMNQALGEAVALFTVDVVLAAATLAPPLKTAVTKGMRGVGQGIRTHGPGALRGVGEYARAFPGRLITLWRAESRAGLNPFVRWGIAQEWAGRTLVGRLSPLFRANSSWLPLGLRLRAIPWQTGKGLWDIIVHHPWSFFGQQWAGTWLSRGVQITWLAGGGVGLYLMLNRYFEDRAIARVTQAILEHPEAFEEWGELVQAGRIGKKELYLLIDLDRELGQAKRESFQKVVEEIDEAMQDGKDEGAIENLRANMDACGHDVAARRDEALKTHGKNAPEYLMWDRVYRQWESQRNRLAAFR